MSTNLHDIPTVDLLAEVDRRTIAALPPAVEFFGVWPGDRSGHCHRDHMAQGIWTKPREVVAGRTLYPWKYWDASRKPGPQEEGKLWHWHHPTEAITLLLSWDRSADQRGGCCATFIVRGHVIAERAEFLARSTFPRVFARIETHLGRPTVLAGPAPTVDS